MLSDRSRKYAMIAAVAVAAAAGIIMAASFAMPQRVALDAGQNKKPSGSGNVTLPDSGLNDLAKQASSQVIPTSISVTPTTVASGGQATIQGNGFSPGHEVTFSVNNNHARTTPQQVVADTSGTFSANVTLPQIQSGERSITAQDSSGKAATVSVNVK
jgi:hypothetical protein